jgi:hypothetical protein
MKRERSRAFSESVEGYRKALLRDARTCQWEAFKARAGRLFDYVESIEMSELKRRFHGIFRVVLTLLIASVGAIVILDSGLSPDIERLKFALIGAVVAGTCFELFFFLDFKMYMQSKMSWYRQRRERFVRNIEQDFRQMVFRAAA